MTAANLGLTDTQYQHLRGIVAGVKQRGMPWACAVIAVETAITESGLQMYANAHNPESLSLPHDAVGDDHGSVGLFQQQVGGAVNSTANWGTTRELMDAATSTEKFLDSLRAGWAGKPRWVAAQDVQNSAYDGYPREANNYTAEYGGNYHSNDARAQQLVNAVWGESTASEGAELIKGETEMLKFAYGTATFVHDPEMATVTRFDDADALESYQAGLKRIGVSIAPWTPGSQMAARLAGRAK